MSFGCVYWNYSEMENVGGIDLSRHHEGKKKLIIEYIHLTVSRFDLHDKVRHDVRGGLEEGSICMYVHQIGKKRERKRSGNEIPIRRAMIFKNRFDVLKA
jgi:hypothetical protein